MIRLPVSVTKPKPKPGQGPRTVVTGMFQIWSGHAWRRRQWYREIPNVATILGLNAMGDTHYGGGTGTAWYIGLITNVAFSAPLSSDTMGSHNWDEWISYVGVRPTWTPISFASGVGYNSAFVQVTPTSTDAIAGLFLTDDNTIGGTTGLLDATGVADTPETPTIGVPVNIRYIKTLTPG